MSETSGIVSIKVVPGASRTRMAGRLGDALKIQVSAAPERGKANAAVIELLAEALGVRASQIEIIAGHASPRKKFRVHGLDQSAIDARLAGT